MKQNGMQHNLLRMVQMALFAGISVVLVAFVAIPLVPGASFLKADFADAPILLATMLFGTAPGLVILLVVSTIQAFLFGGDGWVGLLMHFVASGVMIALVGTFYHHKHKFSQGVLGMVLGTVARAAVMIPMNYIFTVHVFGQPKALVDQLMLPGIIPFNLLQAAINCILAGLLFKALAPFVAKNRMIVQPK